MLTIKNLISKSKNKIYPNRRNNLLDYTSTHVGDLIDKPI